jgi:5-methylcytosine-specific restriction protein A
MATLPMHNCRYPGCYTLTPTGYCHTHSKPAAPRIDNRPTSSSRGYDYRWAQLRKILLSEPEYSTCAMCREHGIRGVPSTVIHHIDGNAGNRSRINLIGVCRSCHEIHHHRARNRVNFGIFA